MAVTVNGTPTTAAYTSGSDTAILVNMPAGIVAGELLCVAICVEIGSNVTITPPSGWTLEWRNNFGTSAICHALYTRIATGSESGSYTWTISPGALACIAAWRIGGQGATYSDASATTASGTSNTPTAPGITTVTDGALGITLFHVASSSNIPNLPSTWTDLTSGNGSSRGWRIAYQDVPTATSYDPVVSGQASSRDWVASMWAIRPLAGGGGGQGLLLSRERNRMVI